MINSIELVNVSKKYKRHITQAGFIKAFLGLFKRDYEIISALNDVNIIIEKGDVIGYIGSNGAGKSTTIKILLGVIEMTGGSIYINNVKFNRFPKSFYYNVGAVFGQRNQLWWDISIENSFLLLKKIYRISNKDYEKRFNEIDSFLSIRPMLSNALRELSLGQKMCCEIAASLIHSPSLVVFDEATIGLDMQARENVRNLIRHFNSTYQTTFFITTHELMEIEKIANKVIVVNKGNIIYSGGMEAFTEEYSSSKRQLIISTLNEITCLDYLCISQKNLKLKQINRFKLACEVEKEKVYEVIETVQEVYGVSDIVIKEESFEEIIGKIFKSDGEQK